MPYWHITLASRGRATLFPSESERRTATNKLAKTTGEASVVFGVVDDHLHDVVEAPDLDGVTRLSRRIRLSLRGVAQAPFNSRDIAPVASRSHLKALVRYVLTQVEHHGIAAHPALWVDHSARDGGGARVRSARYPSRARPRGVGSEGRRQVRGEARGQLVGVWGQPSACAPWRAPRGRRRRAAWR